MMSFAGGRTLEGPEEMVLIEERLGGLEHA